MIFGDIVALAKAGWSFKDVKQALEFVETNPVTQETKPEEVKEAKDAIQELQKQMENTQTNEKDPDVQLGAFAKLAQEE